MRRWSIILLGAGAACMVAACNFNPTTITPAKLGGLTKDECAQIEEARAQTLAQMRAMEAAEARTRANATPTAPPPDAAK